MSTEPNKIYLHDPHGYFNEDMQTSIGNTVQWSEDRIDDEDYEYVRSTLYDEMLEALIESTRTLCPDHAVMECGCNVCVLVRKIKSIIERATGKSIEEVLK